MGALPHPLWERRPPGYDGYLRADQTGDLVPVLTDWLPPGKATAHKLTQEADVTRTGGVVSRGRGTAVAGHPDRAGARGSAARTCGGAETRFRLLTCGFSCWPKRRSGIRGSAKRPSGARRGRRDASSLTSDVSVCRAILSGTGEYSAAPMLTAWAPISMVRRRTIWRLRSGTDLAHRLPQPLGYGGRPPVLLVASCLLVLSLPWLGDGEECCGDVVEQVGILGG
jgi:hypothetical protein